MSDFSTTVSWSGQTLTLAKLRDLVDRTKHLSDRTTVTVSVEPRTSHPTDPGGTIHLSVTG